MLDWSKKYLQVSFYFSKSYSTFQNVISSMQNFLFYDHLLFKQNSWQSIFKWYLFHISSLTHWGRVTHICASDLNIIGSDNGLLPGRRQAIIGTNAGILLIRPWGTNFSEILIEILILSFKKMRLKVSSAKRRPFCLGLNVLIRKHGGGIITY